MRKISVIAHYEYKMLMMNKAAWGIYLASTFINLLDNYPSPHNLARLEFLCQPAYFLYRTICFDALILAFGLLFPLSGRFSADRKYGLHHMFMTLPVQKGQYLLGKLLGGWLYTLTLLCLFLGTNLFVYLIAAPFEADASACITLLGKAVLVSALPVSLFIGLGSTALADLLDIRLFYLLAGILFLVNVSTVGSADAMPFYLVTSGELTRLIWVHPKYTQLYPGAVLKNCLFLAGGGLVCGGLLGAWHRPWRTE